MLALVQTKMREGERGTLHDEYVLMDVPTVREGNQEVERIATIVHHVEYSFEEIPLEIITEPHTKIERR